jgi:hypothetical protein
MPLIHKSLHLKLPSTAQYNSLFALETFAGEYIMPIAQHLWWFWFSRYGAVGSWEVKFRFAVQEFSTVENHYNYLVATFAHGSDGCGDYDYVNDLGGQRFLGQDASNSDRTYRAGLVYEFLTASARLLLASLVHDHDGAWRHERETQSKLNRETSLESAHHMFCNMTGTPTWAAVLLYPHDKNAYRVVSDLDSRQIMEYDKQVHLVDLPRIQH